MMFLNQLSSGRIFLLVALTTLCASCSTTPPIKSKRNTAAVNSPLGIYKSNTANKYWLAILQDTHYLLCSPKKCVQARYQNVPASYGVILIDFYLSDIGLELERLSHGQSYQNEFYQAMKKLRLGQSRPNDLAFNVGDCDGIACVGFGHRRDGVKFFRIETFD